jgi:hypothetical protein
MWQSIQQTAESVIHGLPSDDIPKPTDMAADRLASTIRSEVQAVVSQGRSLVDEIRQRAHATCESVQQGVKTPDQQSWTANSRKSARAAPAQSATIRESKPAGSPVVLVGLVQPSMPQL